MPRQVKTPDGRVHQFPDAATDDEISDALAGIYQRETPPAESPSPAPRGMFSRSTPEDFPVVNVAKGVWNIASVIPEAIKQAVTDPIGTVQGIGAEHQRVFEEAKAAYAKGDYLTAARKGINYMALGVGPSIDASTDKMMRGDIAEGMGEVATTAGLTAVGFRPRGAPVTKPPILKGPANAKDAAAVAFARQRGVPLDVGTATGSQFAKNVQKKVASSYGGANTAEALQTSQAQHLTRVGGELADATAAKPTNPVAAGESVRASLTKQIQDLHVKASGAYEVLREMEQAQANGLPTNPKVLATMDATARTPLAVDITAAVKQLQPLYRQLKRESELGIPMHGAKGRTLAALDGLMNSPNVAPLSVVDAALSDLKALARGADIPELRTSGQATAAQAVQALDAQVRAAAAKAGPNILQALEEGRAATKQKYVTADVLDLLSGEPGQVFRQLTQSKDVGLERLRAVQKLAPKEMPTVARAYIEDLMDVATQEGGFGHADKLWADWNKLGAQTKATLFSKAQMSDLDNFFLVAKRIKENPNPSGTAQVMNATNVLMGIPSWAVAKMLLTPGGSKALTTARLASRNPSKATQALAVAQITKAAQSAGIPLDAIPALGETAPPTTPTGIKK